MQLDALIIDPKDNVATAVRRLDAGAAVNLARGSTTRRVVLAENIPFGHKFALESIKMASPVIKYGETVGLATRDIAEGQHVHVHNVEGLKGRGDKR